MDLRYFQISFSPFLILHLSRTFISVLFFLILKHSTNSQILKKEYLNLVHKNVELSSYTLGITIHFYAFRISKHRRYILNRIIFSEYHFLSRNSNHPDCIFSNICTYPKTLQPSVNNSSLRLPLSRFQINYGYNDFHKI